MTWYKQGTFAATNGIAAVSGATTAWLANVWPGDTLVDLSNARRIYEIASVTNNTSMVLAENYAGTTGTAKSYWIVPTSPARKVVSNLLQRTTDLINRLQDGAANTFGIAKTSTGANAALQLLLSGLVIGRIGAIGNNSLTLQVSADGSTFKNGLVIDQATGVVTFPFGVSGLLFPAGSAAAPPVTFDVDTDTGMYRYGANAIGWAVGGVEGMRLVSTKRLGVGGVVPLTTLHAFGGSLYCDTEDGTPLRLTSANSVGAATNANIQQRRARGSQASPSAILSGDRIGGNQWIGYGATGWQSASAAIYIDAAENFSDSVAGTIMRFHTTLSGSGSLTERGRISPLGYLGWGTTNPTAPFHVNGAGRFGSSTVAGLPTASAIGAGGLIWCSNCPGGAQFVQCNGTNWLKMDGTTIVA